MGSDNDTVSGTSEFWEGREDKESSLPGGRGQWTAGEKPAYVRCALPGGMCRRGASTSVRVSASASAGVCVGVRVSASALCS